MILIETDTPITSDEMNQHLENTSQGPGFFALDDEMKMDFATCVVAILHCHPEVNVVHGHPRGAVVPEPKVVGPNLYVSCRAAEEVYAAQNYADKRWWYLLPDEMDQMLAHSKPIDGRSSEL